MPFEAISTWSPNLLTLRVEMTRSLKGANGNGKGSCVASGRDKSIKVKAQILRSRLSLCGHRKAAAPVLLWEARPSAELLPSSFEDQ